MNKKRYIAPSTTVVRCSTGHGLLATSAPGMKWDPEVNKEYRMNIYEEELEDEKSTNWLPDEITG